MLASPSALGSICTKGMGILFHSNLFWGMENQPYNCLVTSLANPSLLLHVTRWHLANLPCPLVAMAPTGPPPLTSHRLLSEKPSLRSMSVPSDLQRSRPLELAARILCAAILSSPRAWTVLGGHGSSTHPGDTTAPWAARLQVKTKASMLAMPPTLSTTPTRRTLQDASSARVTASASG